MIVSFWLSYSLTVTRVPSTLYRWDEVGNQDQPALTGSFALLRMTVALVFGLGEGVGTAVDPTKKLRSSSRS